MSVRQTSKVVYKDLVEGGFISEQQQEIYELICDNYGLTDRELCKVAGFSDPNHLRPRRNELCSLGLVEEVTKRKCTISNRVALTWKAKDWTEWYKVRGNHPKDKLTENNTLTREIISKNLSELLIKVSLYFISYPNKQYSTKLLSSSFEKGIYKVLLEREGK